MKITMTKKYYERTDSGKSWKSKPYQVETWEMTREQYDNYTSEDAIKFMRRLGGSEHVTRCYTSIGYVPYEIGSISPDRTEKRVATFAID